MPRWDSTKTTDLLKAVLALENIADAKLFFRDLLTPQELNEFANRWRVAQMLRKEIPYTKITKETGMSSTTIARVHKWLKRGTGGYRKMLKKMGHDQ